ncbi:MAG TPA: 4-hydroxy-tetrahydrodipicolinate reductase [Porphyromonadaceae bacterium]|jgi:4-hydroxy-tetrahydrodipicolinate reductase|nr:4-hydroxy-tetrahydrodipicolinate reductase [Porphyromonadaceae bacterium]HBL34039.1 4-hydroxy-tetrahydrodipicolinate reductase [Porphyromonadaceae bacterium]HBX21887.1 4-hydroxy-tetrahydrodipicolinate reductase [Porphyromonadaceae bacterium]HCM19680.1 4-hydroxy-tetrahydrodipicolinate reductase [Porphyromonadaceae bacterium]
MNIALIGYGKMGHEIEKIARERGHTIVCIIDLNEENKFDSPEFKRADVAIEFTSPQSALQNYRRAFAAGVPVVSGTTGWLEHLDEIKKACQNGGNTFFYASNFSLGVNIFFVVNRYLAKIMNGFPAYDVRLEETHHIHKLDAPSGTAITLAEEILASLDRKREWKLDRVDREDQLLVKAFRKEEVPGIHAVTYESEEDVIRIEHEAKSRRGFALGAVVAAEFTAGKNGFLGMQDLLNF